MFLLKRNARISRNLGSHVFFREFATHLWIFVTWCRTLTLYFLSCYFFTCEIYTHILEIIRAHMMKPYIIIDNHDISLYYELFNTD